MEIKIVKLNQPNKNGRIYTDETIGNALLSIQTQNKKVVMGQVGETPSFIQLEKDKISHYLTDLEIKDGYLVGDLVIMNNEAGRWATELIDADLVELGIQGVGFISPSKEVSDFSIMSINLILKPEKFH